MFKFVVRTFTGCNHPPIFKGQIPYTKLIDKKFGSGSWISLLFGAGWADPPRTWTEKYVVGTTKCIDCRRTITYDAKLTEEIKPSNIYQWKLASKPLDPILKRIRAQIPLFIFCCVIFCICFIFVIGIQNSIQLAQNYWNQLSE